MNRFDMAGFQRRIDRVRGDEAVRRPARHTLDPAAPLDPCAVEQQYWRSLWHQPEGR